MKKTGIFFGALGACLAVVLVAGLASAAVTTPHGFGKAVRNETASGQGHTFPATIIDRLEKQGVDVTAARTAILNNDPAALKRWLDAYRTAHPRNLTGCENKPDRAKILDLIEKKGGNLTAARIAVQNRDNAATQTMFDEFRLSHKDAIRGNRTGGSSS